MSVSVAVPHIEKAECEPARLIRLPRIRVAQIVMDYLAHGWSVDEICRQHPALTPAEAHASMLYYWDNQAEIDAEIREEWNQSRTEHARALAQPDPFLSRLRSRGIV